MEWNHQQTAHHIEEKENDELLLSKGLLCSSGSH